ncbi:DNA repair protein [Profundibacterium mesophilum]|uniref:DNA repair protein n=1 Tax=Profundibacterium mesophilum KAUST100406-0324 TaxID=1037889 RepID=A0A921TC92_9RHOB|nr:DNA repair protein [Profundibacterium mesophilum]KAF0676815.1 hypothetical protein PMES_00902 [Profundibacterium mesophilum KAUST100406-0324]
MTNSSAYGPETRIISLLQGLATAILAVAAFALVVATVAAALGLLPWLTLPVSFGETVYTQAGIVIQTGAAVLLLVLLTFIPSAARVMRLEATHRDFSICMSDVADAYAACHRADRAGAFTLASEFDSVKERIAFLRQHPDLGNLEPDVLEAAAQMSHTSREIAEIYSDENVARARTFLRERMEEIETFRDRIGQANTQSHELHRYLEQVELEEDINASQLQRLEEQFGETLTKLGFRRVASRPAGNVVAMPSATAAE